MNFLEKSKQKAVELGESIRHSQVSIELENAYTAYRNDAEAYKNLENFKAMQRQVKREKEMGKVSREEIIQKEKALQETEKTLFENPIIQTLVEAEDAYNTHVNEIMQIVKFTMMSRNR